MRLFWIWTAVLVFTIGFSAHSAQAQRAGQISTHFSFDGDLISSGGTSLTVETGKPTFKKGLSGEAISISGDSTPFLTLPTDAPTLNPENDFSVSFWVQTDASADQRFVILSNKQFEDNSLASQKNAGWVFYVSHGTWAWNIGSGSRRLTYERDNGTKMPLNDGQWHQLGMTYSASRSEVRLYYDGTNWVTYHVSDGVGFDFTSESPLTLGWQDANQETQPALLPAIETGRIELQEFVNAFNALGERPVESDEFLRVIVDPKGFYKERAGREPEESAWKAIAAAESALMKNPYTIHQALEFMEAGLLNKIYRLIDGEVIVRRDVALRFAAQERLSQPDFKMDELNIWEREITGDEVASSYTEHFELKTTPLAQNVDSLRAAIWNIWHGGKHFTQERHGWDSRVRVAEMLRDEAVDVIMMQETYSSGDFIAAELGYYFAETVDWDYLNQGANISVLSRYPIQEVFVSDKTPFNNVGAKVQISSTQDMYVMSNWYGMNQFPDVFQYHESRFAESDTIPVLFGGDFNAVPHTDGGSSPASVKLQEAGFTDAFRSIYPDSGERPGLTHITAQRIDQIYYKGMGLTNTSTRVISTWDVGFPSDHFMILSSFNLDYATR
ncbi:endonuclease/exonuclease/phosphatase family protein [bacterium]|nr:endonuclease/exonuclease/phosphatase family protein [bacterium]